MSAFPIQAGMRRALAGGLSYALGPPLLSALSVPVMAYIIRRLGPHSYGEWQTATSLVALVTILANLGLRGAFVRAVARDPESAAQATAEQMGLRLGLCLLAAGVAMGVCIGLEYSATVVGCTAIACCGLFLLTVMTTLSDLLQALHRLHIVAIAGFVSGAALTVVSGLVVWRGGGPVMLATAYLLGPMLGAVMLARHVERGGFPVRVSLNLAKAKSLLRASRHFTAQQVIGAISANATQVLLPALAGPVSFGFFSAGSLLAMRLAAIPEGLTTAYYPVLAGAETAREAGRHVVRLVLISIAICVPLAAGLTGLASPVSRWLFPADPVLCARVMVITVWSLPLLAIGGPMGYALNAAGKDSVHARLSLAVAAVNLLLTVVLVLRWGLIGASWALPARYIVLIAVFAPCFARCILAPTFERRVQPMGALE